VTSPNGCTATVTYAGDTNHEGSTDSESITITKATSATAVTFEAGPYVYRGTAFTATARVTGVGGLDEAVAVVYGGDCVNVTSTDGCTATATFAGDTNHEGSSDSKSVTITKASSTTVVTFESGPYVYRGSAFTATAQVTGAGELSQSVAVVYSGDCTNVTSADGCTATATFEGDANHDGSSDTKSITITKAPSTTVVTCPPNVTYTGAAIEPCTATATGAGSLNQSLTVSYADNVNAGTATASASYAESANHLGSNDTENFTIDKAATTTVVTCPVSEVYTGFAIEPCSVSVTGPNLNLTPAPVYANNVNVGTATASYNYTGGANHNASSDSENFLITPKALTITANSRSKVYGETVTFAGTEFTSVGLVASDSVASVTLNSPGAGAGATVGNYPIVASAAVGTGLSNYTITYADGTLTVTTAYCFIGFHSPIGGSVEIGNGGSFANPVRAFKLGSTIPVKFTIKGVGCQGSEVTTGIHTLQAIRYTNATTGETPIDASPTDAATTGNQFRLTGTDWHYNLSTKGLNTTSQGIWLLRATLQDGSTHTVWVEIKK
jgi:hypothetical protein